MSIESSVHVLPIDDPYELSDGLNALPGEIVGMRHFRNHLDHFVAVGVGEAENPATYFSTIVDMPTLLGSFTIAGDQLVGIEPYRDRSDEGLCIRALLVTSHERASHRSIGLRSHSMRSTAEAYAAIAGEPHWAPIPAGEVARPYKFGGAAYILRTHVSHHQ